MRLELSFILYFAYLAYCNNSDFKALEELDECTIHNRQGYCREMMNCPPLLNLLIRTKPRPPPAIFKLLRDSHCGFKGRMPIVCCPMYFNTRTQDFASTKTAFSDLMIEEDDEEEPVDCGVMSVKNRIFGGKEVGHFEFPWMALIGYNTPQGMQYRCGGTLINRRYVLTAAHCIPNIGGITLEIVRLGEHDLSSETDCSQERGCSTAKDIPIKRYIKHPNYSVKDLKNDIALIELAEDTQFTQSIQPICLPTKGSRKNVDNEIAVVGGWGATENGPYSEVLRMTEIKISSLEKCVDAYNGIISIDPTQICAGGENGRDSCSGDSGGPMVVKEVNKWNELVYVQYGIVSFGPRKCGAVDRPGVYTRVSSYVDWIMDVMEL